MITLALLALSSRFMPKVFNRGTVISAPELVADTLAEVAEEKPLVDSIAVEELPVQQPDVTIFPDTFNLMHWSSLLNKANKQSVHWLYFGDSQLEGDRITAQLRRMLQTEYGGKGLGFLPIKNSYLVHANLNLYHTKDWKEQVIYDKGVKSIGVLGRNFVYQPSDKKKQGEIILKTIDPKRPIQGHQFTLYYSTIDTLAKLELQANRQKKYYFNLKNDSVFNSIRLAFDNDIHHLRLKFNTSKSITVHGIELSDSVGVYVSNIALRGCVYPQFSKMNKELLKQMLKEINPGFVAIHFGVNLVPDIRHSYGNYTKALVREIGVLKSMLPDVPVLIVGVSDMARKQDGKWYSYPNIDAIKKSAEKSSCDYW
jgi:hypothetical protein